MNVTSLIGKRPEMMMCGASLVSGWIEFSSGQKIVRFEVVKHCLE
jgi:hypothetical protein